jgi:RNA polymerase sigma-70 factor, ECF subfamily
VETVPEIGRDTDAESRFVTLAHEVGEPLRRYVVRRTDPDTAQDVLADTMLVLWRRLPDVPADDPLPWCYAVARRCLANATRTARRQQRLAAKVARLDQPRGGGRPDPDPQLHEALERLEENDRELLRLWAWEGLEPREIAVVLDVTPNAVSIRLHRARGKLADLLGKDSPSAGQERLDDRRPR